MMKKLFFALLAFVFTISFGQEKFTVVLDISHGGNDTGARVNEHYEKDIAFDIAQLISRMNKNEVLEIILTRENDEFIDLKKRAEMINEIQPDLAISLHLSVAESSTLNGMEIYTSEKSRHATESELYAEKLQSFFNTDAELANHNFRLLLETQVPVMIVELGFMSNEEDLKYLTSDEGQVEVAKRFLNYFDIISQE